MSVTKKYKNKYISFLHSKRGGTILNSRDIKLVNETNKKNPNSLRDLIAIIISIYYDGNRKLAANEIRKNGGRYAPDKREQEHKRMTEPALLKILNDRDHIEYWHLEDISRSIGIPVGALLLLSRLISLKRDNQQFAVQSFISGVRCFLERLDEVSQKDGLTGEDFGEFARCFELFEKDELPALPIIPRGK